MERFPGSNDGVARPVLLAVDEDPQALDALDQALTRRFGADYRVVTAASAADGLAAIERLAGEGAEVALVAADLWMAGGDGVDFLRRAHALHPGPSGRC